MIDPELLEKLACPETRKPLRLATGDELAAVNARIEAGSCKTVDGRTVEGALEAALMRADGELLYPVRDEMPRLLVEEGIPVESQ